MNYKESFLEKVNLIKMYWIKRHFKDLKPWKVIKIGTFRDLDSLFENIKKQDNIKFSAEVEFIFNKNKFSLSQEEKDVELFVFSVSDFGFKDGALYENLCDMATRFGFDLCPAEVGPQLRLQYMDQSIGEILHIAMAPIIDSEDTQSIFDVKNTDEGIYLESHDHSQYFWGKNQRFVFCKSK